MAARGTSTLRSDGRPRGNRKAVHVVEKNATDTQRWLAEGESTAEIMAKLKKRGIAYRSARRYIAVARGRWREERREAKDTDVEVSVARLMHLSKKAESEGELSAVAQFEKLLADIRGVRQPQRVDVRGAVAHAVIAPAGPEPLDLAALSEEEFVAYQRAIGKLEAHHALPPASGDAIEGEVVNEGSES